MTKKIDIERLLHWAYRDELPKGRPLGDGLSTPKCAWDSITAIGKYGARIQTSGPSSFGFSVGAPHEDALRIEQAVEALPETTRMMSIDDARDLFAEVLPIAGDGLSAMCATVVPVRSTVISKALLGNRPQWQFETPMPAQMLMPYVDRAGRHFERPIVQGLDADGDLVELKQNRGKRVQLRGLYDLDAAPRSPLRWGDPSPLEIAEKRAEFLAWHTALAGLVEALQGALVEYEPVLPRIPATPWLTGYVPPAVHVIGLDDEELEPLPLKFDRGKVGPGRHSPIMASAAEGKKRWDAIWRRALKAKRDKRAVERIDEQRAIHAAVAAFQNEAVSA